MPDLRRLEVEFIISRQQNGAKRKVKESKIFLYLHGGIVDSERVLFKCKTKPRTYETKIKIGYPIQKKVPLTQWSLAMCVANRLHK